MLNTPGEDDHDGDLDLDFSALDGPDGDPPAGDAGTGDPDAGAGDADDCAPLDDEREQVGYELFDWDPTELDDLDDALHELGLPHEWVSDGYEVVVHEEDEAAVDALLPTVRFPDEIPAEVDDGDDTDSETISALFLAADRMRKDPTGEPVKAFLAAAERIGDAPYGVDEKEWATVEEMVDELVDGLTVAAPIDALADAAARLRDRLHGLV